MNPSLHPQTDLNLITTQWSDLHDSNRFLVRYERAVVRYLEAILKNRQDAEDVAQSFFVRVIESGFDRADPQRGRFRDYLKVGVRNAAVSFLRKKKRQPQATGAAPVAGPRARADEVQREWIAGWQRCLLDRAWEALQFHEEFADANLFHTVLRASIDHSDETSVQLAMRVSNTAGRFLSPEAFRKQLSRARRMFAKLLVREVVQTLKDPTPEEIEEELVAIGLRDFVRQYDAEE